MSLNFSACGTGSYEKRIGIVDCHTEGEPCRIVTSGIPELVGNSVAEKRDFFKARHDHLRRFLLFEPRGHRDMFGAVITEPHHPDADIGAFFMETGGYLNMCGHATIAIVAALLKCNIIQPTEPVTQINIDTPAGLIRTRTSSVDGGVRDVTFENVPSFLYRENIALVLAEKEIPIDIAFGGSFFALVDAEKIGLGVDTANISTFIKLGMQIMEAVNARIEISHPALTHIKTVDLVEFYQAIPGSNPVSAKNIVIFGDGQFDRSPCGTGTCAKIAALVAKGKLDLNATFVQESILGTQFTGKAISKTRVGPHDAIVSAITGNAYVCGFASLVCEADDPFKSGFLINYSF